MSDYFQPPLPQFDDDILQSMQSLNDPSGWQDVPVPGYNWMTQFQQFQQNIGMDLSAGEASLYDANSHYMTG